MPHIRSTAAAPPSTTYLLLVNASHSTKVAVAAITYPADAPTCIARAARDLRDRGHSAGRVRSEAEANALKSYKGRRWNCAEYAA